MSHYWIKKLKFPGVALVLTLGFFGFSTALCI